jgi:prolyl oligopeptidase
MTGGRRRRKSRAADGAAPARGAIVSRPLPLLALLLAACASPAPVSLLPEARAPDVATVSQVDEYHGTPVADPYRWLEDGESDAVRAFIVAQNAVTQGVLDGLTQREPLRARLRELWNVPRVSGVRRVGDAYAWSRNDGLQPQDVVYVGPVPAARGRVLFDPAAWSDDGTVALADVAWSDDGRRAVWATSDGGSDWRTLRVRDVASGEDTGDEVRWVKFNRPAWHPDGGGFWYGRFPEPSPGAELSASNVDMTLWYHRLGEPQSRDTLVHADPAHPDWSFGVQVSDDGAWLVRTTWRGAINRYLVHVRPIEAAPDAPWTALDDTWELDIAWLGNDGPLHYLVTRHGAPRGRIVAVDARDPRRDAWREVVPERADTLEEASLFGDTLVLTYLRDAHHAVRLHHLRYGAQGELALPGLGSVSGFAGRRGDPETFFQFTSFTQPASVFRLQLPDRSVQPVWSPELAFDPADFVTEQVRYPSRDGTQVPMFLVRQRDTRPDGDRPVFLYGYGGFNVALSPAFRADILPLLEQGGVWAQPSLRGGSEYGEAWHEAGMLGRKQNVFDDFIAAGEWLVSSGWTRPGRIAIHGKSNGGLLVGAAMTQRPDLWGCALPGVGVLDMLRYHLFTIGRAWVPEYGSSDDPQAFGWLHGYSPLHNLRRGTAYPPTMVLTADHDDRVVPAHSFKFAAALQAAQGGSAPVLLRVETRAGHGAGKPVEFRIAEAADMWSFALAALGQG